jgi:transcriptional regulator with XRE-family HTH domain
VSFSQDDYNHQVRQRVKLTGTDPEFLSAVSDALSSYKKERGPKYTNALLAKDLGIEESTVSKYIGRKSPIMAEVLARACIGLGISFKYRGRVISAVSFSAVAEVPRQPATQLEFLFDAEYAAEKNSWRMTQRHAEPMEFTLRIKIAS